MISEIIVYLNDKEYIVNIEDDNYFMSITLWSNTHDGADAFGGKGEKITILPNELERILSFSDDPLGRVMHRTDGGPAYADLNAMFFEWRIDGKLHRSKGLPAIETPSWSSWWEHGAFRKTTNPVRSMKKRSRKPWRDLKVQQALRSFTEI